MALVALVSLVVAPVGIVLFVPLIIDGEPARHEDDGELAVCALRDALVLGIKVCE